MRLRVQGISFVRMFVLISLVGVVLCALGCGDDETGAKVHKYVLISPHQVDSWRLPDGQLYLYAVLVQGEGGFDRITALDARYLTRRGSIRVPYSKDITWVELSRRPGFDFTSLTIYTIDFRE